MMKKGVTEFVGRSLRSLSRSMSAKDTPCKPCSESPKKSSTSQDQSKPTPPNSKPNYDDPIKPSPFKPMRLSSQPKKIDEKPKVPCPPSSVVSATTATAKKWKSKSKSSTPPCPPSDERKSEQNCYHHKDLLPPAEELKKFKFFEVKSDCTSFEMKSEGH